MQLRTTDTYLKKTSKFRHHPQPQISLQNPGNQPAHLRLQHIKLCLVYLFKQKEGQLLNFHHIQVLLKGLSDIYELA